MRRQTVQRLFSAMKEAKNVGAALSESGAPRGERRVYTLKLGSGEVFETSDLGRIEQRIGQLAAGGTRSSRPPEGIHKPVRDCDADGAMHAIELGDQEPLAARRMRERFEAKYGDLSAVMRAINHWRYTVEEFRLPFNGDMETPVTEADMESAEEEMLAEIRRYAGRAVAQS